MQLFQLKDFNPPNPKLSSWMIDAYHCFNEKLTNKENKFPCIPAIAGYQLDQFRYGFTDELTKDTTCKDVASLLSHFGKVYKDIGKYPSLILFFNNENKLKISDYEKKFWNLLIKVSERDTIAWPKEIPENPTHSLWEFCFEGERYFVYTATPSHQKRQSRSFPYFMLGITPRWVFDQFQLTKTAPSLKKRIRQRLKEYDSIEPHPALKLYGDSDNFEAKQYFLRDDQSSFSQCPFHK
ncbi:YqcI/YcgG family protein [Aquibacillus albus]|uniref:FPC/CPF motif-containing protein YcgG n=1 Tax=Aquibacillus albus TaxID=1168171 RepID=A0ABS2MZF9_9BACI|nr:YqcI/YcgG family protein [Aquibacillus albus]MBM7571173.1 FPC/CPF motif-containing protein YcgG [Aquibacillus albus]